MNVVAYTRVSSRGQSLASQEDAIRRAAEARGDRIVGWYIEKKSGSSLDRTELNALRAHAREGRIKRLYVFRIDRLSRSGIRDTFTVIEELRTHGVQVVTVADGFSFDGPAADVVLAVLAWAAQMERAALGERIAAARKKVEAEGGRWGRPRKVDPGTLDLAKSMRRKKSTIREIASALKIPRATLHRALSQKGHYSKPLAKASKK
jgi:DNA invertase Pin-like site-specific DNA recombinase